MKKYTFLTDNSNYDNVYYAIESALIGTMKIVDTYENGQLVDASDAGAYVLLCSDNAVKLANDTYNEDFGNEDSFDADLARWELGDTIYSYDFRFVYNAIVDSDLVENTDFIIDSQECKGFNFWNGSYYETVRVSSNYDNDTTHTICDDVLTAELNKAIEKFESGEGTDNYSIIEEPYFSFCLYEITDTNF